MRNFSGKLAHRAVRIRNLTVEALEQRKLLATLATFDHKPTPYLQSGPDALQFSSMRTGGATGSYMRFVEGGKSGLSTLSFDRTDDFAANVVVAEYMFRDTYVIRRTDAFEFSLLNTNDYGALASKQGVNYGKGYKDSLTFRFLINRDINDFEERWNDSSLQVIYDGVLVKDIVLDDVLDLQSGQWHRARFIVNAGDGSLSIDITPEGRNAIRVANNIAIAGLEPYKMRAHFSNSTGTSAGNVDLDSIAVNYLKPNETYVTFDDWRPVAQENGTPISVKLRRFGNLTSPTIVQMRTTPGNAQKAIDYKSIDEPVSFASGQDSRSVDLAMIDDLAMEENEYLWLRAISTSASVKTTDPMAALVRIYDDELGREQGQIQPLMAFGRVPIHTVMLANGKVMFWGRQHDLGPQVYDPVAGEVTNVPIADDHHGTGEHFNVFCSGHTLLPDGRLFVAGGHEENFIGTKTAFIYDPSTNHWIRLPDMNDRRWYPTVMALPNGDVLVLHGTIDSSTHFNEQPEVWQAATNTWRKIHIAQDLVDNTKAHQSDFYPRTFVMPDGRVFYFGAAGATWILDPRPGVSNPWTAGPKLATKAAPNDYGTVTQYAPGKLLVAGGGIPGRADAEVIDLNQPNPQFRAVGFMAYPRRRHNATMLPDGRVLITGGESETPGAVAIQKISEIWDPTTENFTLQAAVDVERVYHSTALLMPDGSVWTGGTGEPTTNDKVREQRNAQLFQPSYLFHNNRPEITLAPSNAGLGQSIYVHVKRPQEIASANLIRLGSVTHSLEQSANFVPLTFSQSAGGLSVNIPASANTVIPGYYFLTVVDYRGVPSESKIIQVLPAGQVALVSISDVTVTESGNADFTVRLSKALATPTTISYRTLAASAQPGLDYTATEQTLIIPAGQTIGAIRIPIVNDAIKEPSEWFAVDLFSATGLAVLSRRRAQAVVRDNDGETPPMISIADGQATEGGDVVVQVSLSARSAFPVRVPFVTARGSATNGDFVSRAGAITIPAGATTGSINIRTLRDGVEEGDQSFYVRLPNLPDLSFADWEALAKVIDAPLPTITPENLSVTEGTGKNVIAYVAVKLSSALDVAASVAFTTKNVSARAGSDFVSTSGTLLFSPGETVKYVPVTIIGDTSKEGAEEFNVVLSAPRRGKLGANQIKVKILNDD